MPRRTLADARRTLDDQRPYLTDYAAQQAEQHLQAVESEATAAADRYVTERVEEIRADYDVALRELTTARDRYDEVISEASHARIESPVYARQLQDVRRSHEAAEAALAKLDQRVDAVAAIEDAPLDWFTDLQQRMLHMRTEVPW